MKFRNPDDAWSFWVNYGGHVGFEVRKRCINKSKSDGKATSARYVCAKEGCRAPDKRDHVTANPRAETKTCCPVRMGLTLNRVEGNYEVFDLILRHNHVLYLPQTFHLMTSQRKISKVQAFEIEAADDSGIRTKVAHELACRQVGGSMNLSYTCPDHKNYLQTRRQRELAYGQAGSMLKYFQAKISENPSFHYTFQLDIDENITNIFWADAKMLIDYAHFGNVKVHLGP
jgi:zinc finger SWIM domain-containing protein 3